MQRRTLLKSGLAALGSAPLIQSLSQVALAANTSDAHEHVTAGGELYSIHPVSHASFVTQLPTGVLYNDPVGGADAYADLPRPDLILITHEHGDHYDLPTLEGLVGENTRLITNPAVFEMLPDALKARAEALDNGGSTTALEIGIEAVPAYNLTRDRLQYHPEGRDNGYVLTLDGSRIYIAGDTEATPEMRALEDIDVAFVPMNLPYTMAVEQAAEGVLDFAPKVVYPYHYKGSDIDAFAALVAEGDAGIEVVRGAWYA